MILFPYICTLTDSIMSETITPYKNSTEGKKQQISTMFDNVSGNYDSLNRVITFGMDVKWRKNVCKIVADHQPESILDIATGTGDMALLYTRTDAKKIVGVDISPGMLEVAKMKVAKQKLEHIIDLQTGDAENLSFPDHSFDVVTVTYGIRNFENLKKGLSEILRVLKPGGILVILETSIPRYFPMRQGYLFYTLWVMPFIGRLFSKDKKAYSYLARSAVNFPYGNALKKILEEVGYTDVWVKPQAQGISTIYRGTKS